jgi:hypothetical protein
MAQEMGTSRSMGKGIPSFDSLEGCTSKRSLRLIVSTWECKGASCPPSDCQPNQSPDWQLQAPPLIHSLGWSAFHTAAHHSSVIASNWSIAISSHQLSSHFLSWRLTLPRQNRLIDTAAHLEATRRLHHERSQTQDIADCAKLPRLTAFTHYKHGP